MQHNALLPTESRYHWDRTDDVTMSDKTAPMRVYEGEPSTADIGIAETHAMAPDQSMTRNRVPAHAQPPVEGQPQPTHVGETMWVGRFQVVEQLGAGAAGVVYRAHDPQLDRMVAVKLLHAKSRAAGAHDDRLLREAKGLARVTHPNVVGVHDVGMHSGQLFVAMELVEGTTLTEWLAGRDAVAGSHDWREALSVLIAAGHGLHAIHQAGLVHRDFKPDNVLIDTHGRARIADFGLVRAADDPEMANETSDYGSSPLGPAMTQTGALMGTPAFMAPEQLQRRAADARSDQFAFCITLYEALYRQPAFVANTIGEQMHATANAQVQPVPPHTTVPHALHCAVSRGLSPAPEQRYPDMAALLSDLDSRGRDATAKPPSRMGLWIAVAGLLTLLLLAGGAWALRDSWLEPSDGGPRKTSKTSKAAAKALGEARKQRDNANYTACSRGASKGPRTDKLIAVWLDCALLADRWDHAGRACKAWKKHVDDPLPTSCEPTVVKVYGFMAKEDWRGCLNKALGDDDPNKHNLALRLVCAHHAEDDQAYGRACKLIKRKFPKYGPARDCDEQRGTGVAAASKKKVGVAPPLRKPRVAPRKPPARPRVAPGDPLASDI
jgi:serine/threonine protein kinase